VLLLVNPFGGKGKAKSICKETVLPILEGAGCKLDVKGVFGVQRGRSADKLSIV
jgi:hypothetical protein